MRVKPLDFERVLRACAIGGSIALLAAVAVTAIGALTRTLVPIYGTTLKFLVATLVVTAPYAELIETRARRIRRIPIDERLGFAKHA
ncbi:MAG TPA: hypothetical protein VIC58_09945 [Actinomycetota bacterium]|jgi:hypothetical protein